MRGINYYLLKEGEIYKRHDNETFFFIRIFYRIGASCYWIL